MRSIILITTVLLLGACTTSLPREFHASERHCSYDRVGVEYELECSSKGIVELSDDSMIRSLVR